MPNDVVTMDKIVSLCKRRGFIFPASEIYGGIANTYDYGHYGVLLKQNVIAQWWKSMIQDRDDIVALDSAIIQHPRTWEASGHLAGFTDPLVDCRTCKRRFRADHLSELECGRRPSKHPGEDAQCDLTDSREFNLMFETTIGPVKEAGSTVYLRPETAQGIFLDFKQVLQFARRKPPFGIAQVGKSFRNEITPGNFIFRTLEFEQMEMEFFVPPAEADKWYEHWLAERLDWYVRLGIDPEHLRLRAHDADELSHYSSATSDVEYLYPIGWSELEGIANRGDFDLTQHAQHSGEKLEYVDPQGGERYIPHVIEPAAGVGALAARVPLRRLRRGRDRRRAAHGAAAASGARAGQGRGAAAAAQGRPPRARARGLRGAAPPRQGRVRRRRRDRPALPAPGRDRHAVRGHDRPPVARGPHGDAARPRHARAGARPDRRARAAAAGPARSRIVFLTWRRRPPTRSPTTISTSAGSGATGAPRRSTSPRTGGSGRRRFSDFERRAALWNYALFFWGEDAVADNLSPFIDAAPREEQKYFLATQQVDEARHAVFFKRFMHEVAGVGDGTMAGGLEAIRPQLTWGFVKTFELLDRYAGELRRDRSRTKLAQAVTLYHVVIEATLAQPGQHFIEDYLTKRDLLPGFRGGMHNVALDEQRHIGFGVKLLRDLAVEDPDVPAAVADLLREVLPFSAAVFVPPGWDRRYSECFGFTVEEIFEEAGRSFESKLRAAGMPLESLPGPIPYPYDLSPAERARRGIAMLQAGLLGEGDGAVPRDPATMELLFDSLRRGVDLRHAPAGPLTLQWDFHDAEPWHLRLDNGSTAVAPGFVDGADVTYRVRYDDFVDVFAGRLDPRRALVTGRLRPRGSVKALWSTRRLFG